MKRRHGLEKERSKTEKRREKEEKKDAEYEGAEHAGQAERSRLKVLPTEHTFIYVAKPDLDGALTK